MINQESAIPCPVCQTKVPFEIKSLMAGMSFSCPNCFAAIGIAPESKDVVEKTMKEFDSLKNKQIKK